MRQLKGIETEGMNGAGDAIGCMMAVGGLAITIAGFEFGPADWAAGAFALGAMLRDCRQ